MIKYTKSIGLVFLSILLFNSALYPKENTEKKYIFQELKRIELKFGDLVFAKLGDLLPLENGYVSHYNESAYGSLCGLVLFSKDGIAIKKYDKRGNGPGEINKVSGITTVGDSILVAEIGKPTVHLFDQELNFVRDYRVKNAGKIYNLGKYVGIWSYNYIREGDVDNIYSLSLYDSRTFEFKGYSGKVNEVPDFVQYWGGIWKTEKNTFALIFPHQYQIFLYDGDIKLKKKLIKSPPKHVKQFTPWKKDKSRLNNDGLKWIRSWTKPFEVFYINGKYLLISIHQGDQYLDVINADGKYILSGYKLKDYCGFEFIKDDFIWFVESDKDQSKYILVKTKLDLR